MRGNVSAKSSTRVYAGRDPDRGDHPGNSGGDRAAEVLECITVSAAEHAEGRSEIPTPAGHPGQGAASGCSTLGHAGGNPPGSTYERGFRDRDDVDDGQPGERGGGGVECVWALSLAVAGQSGERARHDHDRGCEFSSTGAGWVDGVDLQACVAGIRGESGWRKTTRSRW